MMWWGRAISGKIAHRPAFAVETGQPGSILGHEMQAFFSCVPAL
jgi:hypothetical protein